MSVTVKNEECGAVNAIKEAMAAANLKEPPRVILDKCAVLQQKYALTIDDILLHMEAFLSNNSLDFLTIEVFGKFEQDIQREKMRPSPAAKVVKKERSFSTPDSTIGHKTARVTYRETPSPESSQGSRYNSPMTIPDSLTSDVVSKPWAERSDVGKVVVKFNTELGRREEFRPSDKKPLGIRCAVEMRDDDFDNVKERYRYMFTTLDERSRAPEKHMMTMQDSMCALANISPDDLMPVGIPSQESVWVCGRICCDSSVGKINDQSVLLEGSKVTSSGRRVHLDLQKLPGYSLFPGQHVLVYGTNSSGRMMLAHKIIEGVNAPLPSTSPEQLMKFHHSPSHQGGQPLSVVMAAGPFTTSDNLDYDPLKDLLLKALETQPDVLILTGPFVDVSQKILESGDIQLKSYENDEVIGTHSATYEMVFIECVIRDCIASMYLNNDRLATHIILVPSLYDAHHEFVFPQPPFGDRDEVQTKFYDEKFGILNIPHTKEGDRKRVHLMSNPCMFRVNEVLFGVTSNDVCHSLLAESISTQIPGVSGIARVTGHILQQQSFAPQFPPSTSSLAQLDMRQAKHWQMKWSPDVLVIPSRMTPLMRDIEGTLVVNPGQVVKVTSGGMYAALTIHPIKETVLREAEGRKTESLLHSVPSRTCGEIIKI